MVDLLVDEVERQRMSQAAIGDRLRLSQGAVSRRMTGVTPWRADELEALADALGLEVHVELVPAGGA